LSLRHSPNTPAVNLRFHSVTGALNANPCPSTASKAFMFAVRRYSATLLTALFLGVGVLPLSAQSSQADALQTIRSAVESELQANRTDKSIWTYRDHDNVPGKDATYTTFETRQGALRRMIELDGRPLSPSEAQAETLRLNDYVHDSSAQAKARKNAAHDDAQAAELLNMLPNAFIWNMVSQSPEFITLGFRPNPTFDPPNIEARIMGMMAGQVLIARDGNRIRTLKGQLTENVSIGFGLVRMYKSGTFDIERRLVGGGHWQITETHVHIGGHALFFKSIGTQEDEMKTDWKPSPANTLEEAARILSAQP
jgi:hypothetical protein